MRTSSSMLHIIHSRVTPITQHTPNTDTSCWHTTHLASLCVYITTGYTYFSPQFSTTRRSTRITLLRATSSTQIHVGIYCDMRSQQASVHLLRTQHIYSNYLCTPSNSGHIFGEAVTLFCLGEHVSVHYAAVHFDHNKLPKLLAIGHEELVHSQILGSVTG